MSLPGKLLEDLLSRYMDGELSADEQARVELILGTDEEARNLLEDLRAQSALIKSVLANPPMGRRAKLSDDFASRVVDLAVVKAVSHRLPETHPLQRVRQLREDRNRRNYRIYAGLVVLAAGILLAGFLIPDRENEIQLAESTPDIANDGIIDFGVAPLDNLEDGLPYRTGEPLLANEATDNEPLDDEPLDAILPSMIANATANADSVPSASSPAVQPATADQVASDESSARSINSMPTTTSDLESGMEQLKAVFVYEIVVTPSGRENNVVGRVFRESGIRVGDERQVDDTLVGFLREGGVIGDRANEAVNSEQLESEDANPVQLLFLEGSGRKLESCMLKLLASTNDVRQVGFNMMMNPPVVAAIGRLKDADVEQIRSIDPEAAIVAHALSTGGNDGSSSFTVNDDLLPPLDPSGLTLMSLGTDSASVTQVDFITQVLLIVRYE